MVQSVGFPRSDAKWERFGGLVPLECERIRRGFIHLDVDVLEVADVGDVRDSIALEVQLLLILIVFCGREGEETSTKVLRAFAAGIAVFREQGKMPVRAGTPVRP